MVLCLWMLIGGAQAQEKLLYTVSVPNPDLKKFHVIVRVQGTKQEQLKFVIPAWCPGFYFLQSYEKGIENVRAMDAKGNELPVSYSEEKKREWVISKVDPTETVLEYDVKCLDRGYGFFLCAMGEKNGFINGPACFMYLDGHKEKPTELTVHVPGGWKIATGMERTDKPNVFRAINYDELIDSPIEMGELWIGEFKVGETLFEISIAGTVEESIRNRWMDELKKVSETAVRLMKGAPFKRYLYIIHATQPGSFMGFGGGLEHLYSTVLGVTANSRSLAGLAAHELFHTWNVKRIRPAVLGPFDYTGPVYTNNLWFAEGVTEYYANLITARAGLDTHEELLSSLSGEITRLQNSPARSRVTLAESSYKVWDGGMSMGYRGLDYYNKGCVVGLLLDLKLRAVTGNKKSLDDLMLVMMERHNFPKAGYAEDGILKVYSELAKQDMKPFYTPLVESMDELPFNEVLQAAGLELVEEGRRRTLKRIENPTPEQKKILEGWLEGKTD
jgi:predicted metalloprotease with PDZ domain